MKSVILAAGLCALTMTGKGQQPAEVPGSHVLSAGDELLVFHVRGRAAPPLGYDLKTWKVGATAPIELGTVERVEGRFGSTPVRQRLRWATAKPTISSSCRPLPATCIST